eukprot:TRINITY_DN28544_c0_g1_i1.p1 TRINITY_DN28544_c0_g1~~TRINITY_DN28544_c0_g1_i1.p1  ORF type:complete len:626 (+),score=105.01 TRINITY_DN28544_c0_g1_i1:122-1999(+)
MEVGGGQDSEPVEELVTGEATLQVLRSEVKRLRQQVREDVRAELRSFMPELVSAAKAHMPAGGTHGPHSPSKTKVGTGLKSYSVAAMRGEVFESSAEEQGQSPKGKLKPKAASLAIASFAGVSPLGPAGEPPAKPSADQEGSVPPPAGVEPPGLLPLENPQTLAKAPWQDVDDLQEEPGAPNGTPSSKSESVTRLVKRKTMKGPTSRRASAHQAMLVLEERPDCVSWARRKVGSFIYSQFFEAVVVVLILTNALWVGVQANDAAVRISESPPESFRKVDLAYVVLFTVEVCLRAFVQGMYFFVGETKWWNWFDLLLVFFQLLEEILIALGEDGDAGSKGSGGINLLQSSSILRVVRIIRAARVLRVVRVLQYASELRLLLTCIFQSIKSFAWAAILLILMNYVVSIYFTQMVTMARLEGNANPELEYWYGSVARSMLSLIQGITGGCDWDSLVSCLLSDVSVFVAVLLVLYIGFALIAVMNIVMGTFVESAIQRASEVKKLQTITRAKNLFESIDVDTSGEISFDEIRDHLDTPSVQNFFKEIDIHVSEAQMLFQVLDGDGTGSLSVDEFMQGCVRLNTPCTSLDMLLIARESRAAVQEIGEQVRQLQAGGVDEMPGGRTPCSRN